MSFKASTSSSNPARGFVMLEALVALLIFAIGILGLVGAQSASVKDASSARYRAVAAAMAGDLISRMWLSDRTAATLQASFDSASAGSGYSSWLARVQASGLPGVDEHPPEVSFSTVAGGGSSAVSSSLATVKVYWKAPGDSQAHTYTALAQLK
jgi:type IV pilus assembly protein PilV